MSEWQVEDKYGFTQTIATILNKNVNQVSISKDKCVYFLSGILIFLCYRQKIKPDCDSKLSPPGADFIQR